MGLCSAFTCVYIADVESVMSFAMTQFPLFHPQDLGVVAIVGKWRGPLPNRDLDCAVTTDHDEWRWQWHHLNVWNGETIRISGSNPRHLQVLRKQPRAFCNLLTIFLLNR